MIFARLRYFAKTSTKPREDRITPASTRKIAICTIQTLRQHGGAMSIRRWRILPFLALNLRTAVRERVGNGKSDSKHPGGCSLPGNYTIRTQRASPVPEVHFTAMAKATTATGRHLLVMVAAVAINLSLAIWTLVAAGWWWRTGGRARIRGFLCSRVFPERREPKCDNVVYWAVRGGDFFSVLGLGRILLQALLTECQHVLYEARVEGKAAAAYFLYSSFTFHKYTLKTLTMRSKGL